MRNINPVPVCAVKIDDPFWNRSLLPVRDTVIPYQREALNDRIIAAEPSNCIKNVEIAASRCTGEFHGFVFQDSDIYKWLESVAYSLETHPDPDLEEKADFAIDLLAEAQMPDGYLNTYVNLYLSSEVTFPNVKVKVETDYPRGDTAKINAEGNSTLYLRSPGAAPVIRLIVNGAESSFEVEKGYISVPVNGSVVIELTFDLSPKFIYTHTKAHHTTGKAAVQLGPVVYCAESADNEYPIGSYFVRGDAEFSCSEAAGLLPEKTPLLTVYAFHRVSEDTSLYTTAPPSHERTKLTLIPYHLWGNRGEGEVAVYFNITPSM